jgi:transcriptional regulator with XRE-family HTH domain
MQLTKKGKLSVKAIRDLRSARGWTQLELAYRLGVTPATVSNWERGVFAPKATQLRMIAHLFGVSMDEIALPGNDRDKGDGGKAAA